MPIDYRQLQGPALIDTTPLETGGAATATALAHTFKAFEATATDIGVSLRQQQGQREGAAAGATGTPGLKTGFAALTAYGQAYNNAATRSYAIKAEADAEDQAARLQVEAGTDPGKFNTTFSAVRDATIAHAPPEARRILADVYNRRLGSGIAAITTAQAEEFKNEARTDASEGVARSVDRIGNWRASNDPNLHAQADEEQVKLNLLIDGARNDGTFSDIEAEGLHKHAQRQIVASTITAQFRGELSKLSGDPVGFIRRLQESNKTSEALPAAEEQQLVQKLFTELGESNRMDSMDKRMNGQYEKMQFEAGDREATSDLLANKLTTHKLLDMVQQQRLEPSVARTLMNELHKGDEVADDPKVAFDIKTNLLHHEESEIATMPGLSWKTRSELILKRREESAGWKGTQAAREGEQRIDRALGIIPGTIIQALPEDVRTSRNQALTTWYSTVDGLPADQRQNAVISSAEDVIGRFIRKNKSVEAQNFRQHKAEYIKTKRDPGSMGKHERAEFDKQIATYDRLISTAEAEAARK